MMAPGIKEKINMSCPIGSTCFSHKKYSSHATAAWKETKQQDTDQEIQHLLILLKLDTMF